MPAEPALQPVLRRAVGRRGVDVVDPPLANLRRAWRPLAPGSCLRARRRRRSFGRLVAGGTERSSGKHVDDRTCARIWDDHRVRNQIEEFQRDGATVLRAVVDDRWLALLAEGVEYNRNHPSEWSHWYTSPDEAVGFWSDYVTWPVVEQYRRVVFESGLAELARELMGSTTVRFFHEHVLVKEPGATEPTPWHHDDPYYGIDGMQNVSMWIALDPVPASSGLQFIAGSHLLGSSFRAAQVHRPDAVRRRRRPLRAAARR